jgi:phenylacetate-CoA ligase
MRIKIELNQLIESPEEIARLIESLAATGRYFVLHSRSTPQPRLIGKPVFASERSASSVSLIQAATWYLKQSAKTAVALIPFRFRRSACVERRARLLASSESWTREKLETYQIRRLNEILLWAAVRVPYYRRLGVRDLLPLGSFEDLKAWPIVDRSTVSSQRQAFLATGFSRCRVRHGTTTGSSGTPLAVTWEWPSSLWWEQAFVERAFDWAGLPFGFKRAVLRGNVTHGPRGTESRYFQAVPHQRSLILSTFQLNSANVEEYLDAIRAFGAQALQAYPSAAARLARLASDKGLAVPSLVAILTSSEMLTPTQRVSIESGLGAPVYDLYGHAERAVAAANCGVGDGYHIFEEYGYVEVLDDKGAAVPPQAEGEIVATGFHNRAMPFIRYRTGDRATRSFRRCECGRTLALLDGLAGRTADYLVDRSGNRISVRMGLGIDELDGIRELCFVQPGAGLADLFYVAPADTACEGKLLSAVRQRLGPGVTVSAKRVSNLPVGPLGKTVFVRRLMEDDTQ